MIGFQNQSWSPMAEYKFPLFDAIEAVDKRDNKWLERQSEEVKKAFPTYMFIRYISSCRTNTEDVLVSTNEYVNPYAFDIAKEHPELIFKIAAIFGSGKKSYHDYIPANGKTNLSNKARDLIAQYNPNMSDSEVDLIFKLHTKETFSDFVNGTGINSLEVKEIIKAYDKIKGEPKSAKRK